MIMKYTAIITIIISLCISFQSYATEQIPDRLIIKGDTMDLHALPLYDLKDHNIWEKPMFQDSLSSFSTGCWRGYIAFWELIDDKLYLTDIYNEALTAKADLNTLFEGKITNGKVHAYWFSDTVTAYKGKLLYYRHMGFSSIFEHEFEYVFERGLLKNSLYFDNTKSKNTPFFMDLSPLRTTIDSLIDWKSLPTIEEPERVYLLVSSNELGQVDSVIAIDGKSEIYKQEALRVARSITQLPVIYKRGKQLKEQMSLQFVFTREKQKKYQ